jgi:hypothetical protein
MNDRARRSALARARLVLAAVFVLLALAGRASAVDLSGTLEGGWYDMTNASKSAKAVLKGASGGPLFGLSVRVGFGRSSFFVSGHGRFMEKSGERAFVADATSPVFRLGHPLKLRIVPAYALLGYSFGSRRSALAPYVGLGGGVTSYKEESTVAGIKDTFSATKPSGHVAAGLDYGRGGLRFGAEVTYSLVPNAIGEGGVSQVYGEDDVGGLSGVIRITFGGGR